MVRPWYGPSPKKVLDSSRPEGLGDFVLAIMDLGGTLVIRARNNTRYFLPPDWPHHAYTDDWGHEIAQIWASGREASELLLHTISVADAAAALGKSEKAILTALKHGALGGLRVRGMWRVSKRSVEEARPETSESRDRGSAGKIT